MAFDINEWYNSQNVGEVLLSFRGTIGLDIINDALANIEKKFDTIDESSKVRKKLFNVLVESLQNLFHHVSKLPVNLVKELGEFFAVFFVIKNENNYCIKTGNFVTKDKVQFLKDRIDQINYLSKDDLKALYKLILNNEEFSEKGGGGLGMIDIARKSGNKLIYNFFSVNKNYSFFTLDVYISK